MKHIKMPKELATKWLAALHSGKYVQGQGYLYKKDPERFCCLGVLEHCADGSVEDRGIPSYNWVGEHKIIFLNKDGNSSNNPYLSSWNLYATAANDEGKSFEEIAKELEKEIEFTDEDNKVNNKPEIERLDFVPAERELVFRIREGIDRHVYRRNLADNRQRRHTDTGFDLDKDKKNERPAT